MTHHLYILGSNKLIIGILGRDYGGITKTAGPIRSRCRTPTKHLGSPLLDHFIKYYQAYFDRATELDLILSSEQYSRAADVFRDAPTPLAGTVYSIMQWDLEFEALGPLLAS
jgi:hypothetical protein